MNADRSMNGLLKAGLIANGVYVALMFLFLLVVARYARFESGFMADFTGSEDTWLEGVVSFVSAMFYARLLAFASLGLDRIASSFVTDVWPFYIVANTLFVIFAVSMIGTTLIATGRRKSGAILALCGTVAFFPLGIVGAVGAWRELPSDDAPEVPSVDTKTVVLRTVVKALFAMAFVIFQGLALYSTSLGNDRDATLKAILAAALFVLTVMPYKRRA